MHFLLIPYALLSATFLLHFLRRNDRIARAGMMVVCTITLLGLCVVAGLREPEGDSARYALHFHAIRGSSFSAAVDTDPFFWSLTWLVGQLTSDEHVYFLTLTTLFVTTMTIALWRLLPGVEAATVAMASSMFPFFVLYAVNGLRQGLAMGFLMHAYVELSTQRRWRHASLWLMLAAGSHVGSAPFVIVAALHCFVARYASLYQYLQAFGASMLLSLSGLNEPIDGGLASNLSLESRHDIYFDDNFRELVVYQTGFRIDFAIFSVLPVVSHMLLVERSTASTAKENARWWTKLYLALNCVYHAFAFIPFSDRVAAMSWVLMPLVVYQQARAAELRSPETTYGATAVVLNLLMLQFYTGSHLRLPYWLS